MRYESDFVNYYLVELNGWKASIRQQEFFQWAGLAFVIAVQIAGQFSPRFSKFALFFIPLYYFSVARADYLIHRDGRKAKILEMNVGYSGNETFQAAASSKIAVFDLPLFLGISVLAKWMSPYPVLDISWTSVAYWSLLAVSLLFIWLATIWGASHGNEYHKVWDNETVH